MEREIIITLDNSLTLTGCLNSSQTAEAIYNALPLSGRGEIWGQEVYMLTDISVAAENPRETVQEGDLAYWPPLKALCLFGGPTPISMPGEIRPAGPVNIFGRLTGDLAPLRNIQGPVSLNIKRR